MRRTSSTLDMFIYFARPALNEVGNFRLDGEWGGSENFFPQWLDGKGTRKGNRFPIPDSACFNYIYNLLIISYKLYIQSTFIYIILSLGLEYVVIFKILTLRNFGN